MDIKRKPESVQIIADMKVGQMAYTMPWAVAYDNRNVPYLNTSSTITDKKIGTSEMKIKKIGPGREDYEVDVARFRYQTGSTIPFPNLPSADRSYVVCLNTKEKFQSLDDIIGKNQRATVINTKQSLHSSLETQLKKAIKVENYELAAELRDQLKKLDQIK